MKMFPETKFVHSVTLRKQLDHMLSELIEVEEALNDFIADPTDENRFKLIEEIIDLKHSSDSELHNLFVTESEHIKMCDYVVHEKNFPRGYYKIKKNCLECQHHVPGSLDDCSVACWECMEQNKYTQKG